MMNAALFLHHAEAHVKSVEEDAGHPQCNLRQVQHDTGLVDKVDALCSSQPLLGRGNTLDDARGAVHLVRGEVPLIQRCHGRLPPGLRRGLLGRGAIRPRRRRSRAVLGGRGCRGRHFAATRRRSRRLWVAGTGREGWRLIAFARRPVAINARHLRQRLCRADNR